MAQSTPADGDPIGALHPHDAARRARSFGSIAAQYDRFRPGYPAALVADLRAAITAGAADPVAAPTLADIGAGTGLFAADLRAGGFEVTAVEPDHDMAEVARARGLAVEEAAFEEWDPAGRRFDAVAFGQSWHWVDQDTGPERLADLLVPDGVACLAWNEYSPAAALSARLAAVEADYGITVHRRHAELLAERDDSQRATAARALADAGFRTRVRWYDWDCTVTPADWLESLMTFSEYAVLADEVRAEVRARLRAELPAEPLELVAGTLAVFGRRPAA
ncbi:class I SAM-dependent methyltransferase [Brevibacterium rongguiense]|uniref:class I SAM-dependent methyltransferase n=1 Tax=Brevibacterium rongguiense TaxID=2695267 RepID=UPI001928D906|nr:class I SAM-dependent methyltransferase [Brevibacterium rongguiense]